MSYDVVAGDRDVNYTSNMAPMFRAYGVWPGGWEGRQRSEVGREIGEGLRRIIRDRNRDRSGFDEKWRSQNGWGSVPTALQFLLAVYLGCYAELPETVQVWR